MSSSPDSYFGGSASVRASCKEEEESGCGPASSVSAPGAWYQSVLPKALTASHYQQAMTAADSFGAIVNSLKLASLAMLVDVGLGLVIAYLLVRAKIRGRDYDIRVAVMPTRCR